MPSTRQPVRLLPLLFLASMLGACGGDQGSVEGTLQPPADPFVASMDSINTLLLASPRKASLYVHRAQLFMSVDSLTLAERDLERAIGLDSTNVDYHLQLGDLYYRTIQIPKSFAQFERASRIDPDNTSAILKQAEIQLVLKNYERSMGLVNEALRKDQHAAHGYFLKGWIYKEIGDTALAISSFRTAVEQNAEDYSAYVMLGKISAARQDPLAAQYYATAISLRPYSVEAWYNKGMFHQENGQDSMALECYREIMQIDPNNALAWYNSGYVRLEHLDDPERARLDFEEAVRLEPEYADAWYNRGLTFERVGELDSAASNYERVLRMLPTHDLAAKGLSRMETKGVKVKLRELRSTE